MARIATAGTSSCATIAIGGIKTRASKAITDNEEYLKDKETYKLYDSPRGKFTPDEFYKNILYPTKQELGETRDYPLDMLLDLLEDSSMSNKLITVILNSDQYHQKDYYWPNRLLNHGFKLIDKTSNDIGSINYLFTRNYNRVDFTKEDKNFS